MTVLKMTDLDLAGKRVGVRSYAQTTGLWIRGVLRHEYGVDLDKVTWMTLGDERNLVATCVAGALVYERE